MKRFIYIFLATILGVLLSFLVHVVIEIPMINLLVNNFEKYNLGFNWEQWFLIHIIFSVVLFIIGAALGVRWGFRWWRYIYIEKKYGGIFSKIKKIKIMKDQKKIFLIIAAIVVVIVVLGAVYFLKKDKSVEPAPESENYFYQNKDLGFSLELPPELMYFQTQRKETEEFVDLEIFVPTSDRIYPQEVEDYAKPIVVRIFNNREAWDKTDKTDKFSFYYEIGEKNGKVYTIKVWRNLPVDWERKWTVDMEEKIVKLFRIL